MPEGTFQLLGEVGSTQRQAAFRFSYTRVCSHAHYPSELITISIHESGYVGRITILRFRAATERIGGSFPDPRGIPVHVS